MYNDTIKAENKIITSESLAQIFQAMVETLKKYLSISEYEEKQNRMYNYEYQNYTFKDEGSRMRMNIDFYDNTNISFDNYDNFISIFYNRTAEIKTINVDFYLNYSIKTPEPNRTNNIYYQSISLYITETKFDISLNLNSQDPKLDEIYKLIKDTILNAPEKYDETIKKRRKITSRVAWAIGFIPGIILPLFLLFFSEIRMLFIEFYIYPIVAIILSYIIGYTIANAKLDKLFKQIVPEKVYAGHDRNYNSVYKDDVESFIQKSEILIGKNIDHLKIREKINETYKKYKNFIPVELALLVIVTLILILFK